jgi:hypothetical protein
MGIRDEGYTFVVFTHFCVGWMGFSVASYTSLCLSVLGYVGVFLGGKEGDIDMRKKRKVDVLSAIAEKEMK